jgi:hypothetical protein
MRQLIVATMALLTACGTDSVAIDDYPSALREAYCRYLVKCGVVEDEGTCAKANLGGTFYFSASEKAAVDMGKLEYHGGSAQKCFDAFAARSCDVTSESNRVLPDACVTITVGAQHAGESCADDAECVSKACDVPVCDQACCVGTCNGDAAPGVAKVGESCAAARCDARSVCDSETTTCVALKPSGGFCVSSTQCEFGLDCDATGACASLPALGQTCAGPCRDEGTTCSSTSHTCVKVALAGEACLSSADCSPLYRCDATKHCTAGIALGQPCQVSQRCADDLAFCDVPVGEAMGTCTLPKPEGMPCQRDLHCASHACDATTRMCVAEPVCI